MTPRSEDISYDTTLKALLHSRRGSYSDLSYMPAFRASGLFFAIVDERTTTRVSFVNYWREKNHNSSIGALLTLRDAEGVKLARHFFPVEGYVYQIDVRDLLELAGPFVGSLEVEVFSSEDLKFQFPALTVFYETPEGISFVHTNQRVYNNAEDREKGEVFNPWQTGFDLCFGNGYAPFVFVMNGPTAAHEAAVELKLINGSGELLEQTLQLGDLPAYGARRLDLGEIQGVADFLGDQVGFCKLNVGIDDVYCRFACGNAAADGSWLSVTHSYFDANEHNDYYDASALDDSVYPCFIPFNVVKGLEVDLVIYPIMSKADLQFSLECFDEAGRQRAWIDISRDFDTTGRRMERIEVRKVLRARGIEDKDGLYCLHIEAEKNRIPARITYGLNYRTENRIGCNISSSAYIAKSYGVRPRSYLWGSLVYRNGGRNLILVSHFKKVKGEQSSSDFQITIYGKDGVILENRFTSANATGLNLVAEDMLETAEYRPQENEVLWYVLESGDSSFVCNQLHVSKSGFVGGDHSF